MCIAPKPCAPARGLGPGVAAGGVARTSTRPMRTWIGRISGAAADGIAAIDGRADCGSASTGTVCPGAAAFTRLDTCGGGLAGASASLRSGSPSFR